MGMAAATRRMKISSALMSEVVEMEPQGSSTRMRAPSAGLVVRMASTPRRMAKNTMALVRPSTCFTMPQMPAST